ncbi:MAG: GTP-binding protein [Nanoarchaeota archaeon]|nr:GTP-binding protein [Nanoarchaeota archaeon]
MKTGIPKLDGLLNGGIKEKSSVLFCADPGVTNQEFAQQLLFTCLQEGHKGLYFVNNKSPQIIKKVLQEYGWHPEKFEKTKQLYFIDDFSALSAQTSHETFIVNQPTDFNQIEATLLSAFQKLKNKNMVFIFDSLSSLIDLNGTDKKIFNYLKKWLKAAQENNITPLFLFTQWPYGKAFIKNIRELFDCIVDLKAIERKIILRNYFTISKAKWLKQIKPVEIPFKVTKPGGIKVYIPKILVTGPFNAGKTSFVHSASIKAVSVDRFGTTVALDHGHVDYHGFAADLFGTPGQERFDPILKHLGGESIGVIIVVDSTKPEDFVRAKHMLELTKTTGLPSIIVANKANLKGALKPAEIRSKMKLSKEIPIIPLVAQNLNLVKDGKPCQLKEQDIQKVLEKLFKMVI